MATNPILVSASPVLISVLQSVQQFNTDMGVNPAVWAVNFPGAILKLQGAIALALPEVEVAEASTVITEVNTKISALITKLQSLSTPAA